MLARELHRGGSDSNNKNNSSSSGKDQNPNHNQNQNQNDNAPNLPFVEVHVDVSVEEAERRDPKGLYKKARQGLIPEFTGVSPDAPYEAPDDPEVYIKGGETNVEDAVKKIVAYLRKKGYLMIETRTG